MSILLILTLVAGTIYGADRHLPFWLANPPDAVDRVIVDKQARQLYLMHQGKAVRHYSMGMGKNPENHKVQEGDSRTPEGTYTLDWRNPNSRFFRSLHISYPNTQDKATAEAKGVSPGGAIMIHGAPNGLGWLPGILPTGDWTDGCIAVTNAEMAEIWQSVVDGTPIEIHASLSNPPSLE
ncbi:MAG: L,D-transpeptidase family protein [Magnetococcales bacterium]|nr:L,D-transpeptidase family protein [Magnetococcales bacterium]